jgi:crotonobetainyl-CoA:carnitine CoA-transferase CaiB-like acyl-CoA transferase
MEGGEGGRPPYRARDGWVVISAAGREMAARLMRLVGAEEDATPMPGSSVGDRRRAFVERWCAERTVDEICSALTDAGVPVGPVRTIPEVAKDPHLWEREMLVKMEDAVAGEMFVPGVTIKMSRTPGRVGPVPTPGQHTDLVLRDVLGLDAAVIADLRAREVVR